MVSADWANVGVAVASAAAAGGSWVAAVRANGVSKRANEAAQAANRTADAVAQIERDRWHAELTPDFGVRVIELGPGTHQASIEIKLKGPIALVALDRVAVHIQDDGYTRLPGAGVTRDEIDSTVFGPYRLRPRVDGADDDGRIVDGGPLAVGDWTKFALERTRHPHWSTEQLWADEYDGKPVRLTIECSVAGQRPWYIPHEVLPLTPDQARQEERS